MIHYLESRPTTWNRLCATPLRLTALGILTFCPFRLWAPLAGHTLASLRTSVTYPLNIDKSRWSVLIPLVRWVAALILAQFHPLLGAFGGLAIGLSDA